MSGDHIPLTNERRDLERELSKLSRQQNVALQTASYEKMSKAEAEEYDERRIRIAEICALLSRFNSK